MSQPLAIAIIGLKALFVVLFSMIVAVVLTWADRRQGAMIQDRVGPNRAVAFLPGKLAAALSIFAGLVASAGVVGWAMLALDDAAHRGISGVLLAQLSILATWVVLVSMAGRVRLRGAQGAFDAFLASLGDPRRIAKIGLAVHALTLIGFAWFQGSSEAEFLQDIGLRSGPAVFSFSVLGGSLYAAWSFAKCDKVGLRLAGLLHPAADGLKMIFKEDFIPPKADRLVHGLAPFISFFPVIVVLAVVPFGDSLCLGAAGEWATLGQPASGVCQGVRIPLQVLDLDAGILFYFAIAGTGIIGAVLAGWASDNKFSLMGALRGASQMVSYEVTLGLTLVGLLMIYGTLRIDQMVEWQKAHGWGIFVQPFAFLLFFAAAVAEAKRTPFDLPEGESELVAGYFTEYAGMKFAMFFFAEYIAIVTSSALMAALFFGGWHLPFVEGQGLRVTFGTDVLLEQALPQGLVVGLGFVAFIGKTLALCWLQLLVRWTVPRFRYDQLMRLGWKTLLPASLANILVTGFVVLLVVDGGSDLEPALGFATNLSQWFVALLALAAAVGLGRLLLSQAQHRPSPRISMVRFTQILGGTTRTTRMGA